MKNKVVAIVLAAGQGKRMNSQVAKQYLHIKGKPLLYYTLQAFEHSDVDEIILVTGKGEEQYCREQIIDYYSITKVKAIIPGGAERYDSVYQGLKACQETAFVLIHDGARPCITPQIINRTIEDVIKYEACIVAVPVKDTIKKIDENGFVNETLERNSLLIVQTPQAFSYSLISNAYDSIMHQEHQNITDDAMVVEAVTDTSIHVVEGSYCNIKVTTPEDLVVAERFLTKIERYE